MPQQASGNGFDVIVIGSGMGGMATAAALSRMDHNLKRSLQGRKRYG